MESQVSPQVQVVASNGEGGVRTASPRAETPSRDDAGSS